MRHAASETPFCAVVTDHIPENQGYYGIISAPATYTAAYTATDPSCQPHNAKTV